MGTLYIMRGLPGSGKSTKARALVGPRGLVAAADDWHIRNGVYQFKTEEATQAHWWNQARVRSAMAAGVPLIAADNTNIRWSAMEPYVRAALVHHYDIEIVPVNSGLSDEELAARTIHAVPVEIIARMRESWEEL